MSGNTEESVDLANYNDQGTPARLRILRALTAFRPHFAWCSVNIVRGEAKSVQGTVKKFGITKKKKKL